MSKVRVLHHLRIKTALSSTFGFSFIRTLTQLHPFPTIVTSEDSRRMAGQHSAPRILQSATDIAQLVHKLNNTKNQPDKKQRINIKKQTFEVEASPAKLMVDSWRLQDWDYKRDNLPTYARGLFTGKNENSEFEIAIRGYDKFFNVGEVNATKWDNIEKSTKGPYELSLKENGCIIFISGLHDGTLLVCSKHSTGARGDADLSHAKAGDKWIDRQLQASGRTRADLAKELRDRNATAVAELCDDEFEEHILPYEREAAGLYLHGINLNLPQFVTYSGAQVQAFAAEWGFKKTDYLMIDDIQTTKSFLEQVAETGSYNGRDLEGFVIRCKSDYDNTGRFSDWFFKYKFEEPYLMYRQWRECTKAVIAGKPPRYKKHVKLTQEYLLFARKQLAENSDMAKDYQLNHGIIKLRNDFLKEKNLKGSDIIREEYASEGNPSEASRDIILVPVATIGCGKTTIAVALQHLFGWGHVQNDNILGKGRPPRFVREVLEQLKDRPVVIADRNNAQSHERDQIITDIQKSHPHVRLVCLNFAHTPQAIDRIRQVTRARVLMRGDNHQTIKATTDPQKLIGIMEGFISRYEPCNPLGAPDDGFDSIIELDPAADSRENLETVVGKLQLHYPNLFQDMPSSDDLDEAIDFAINTYKVDLRHTIPDRGQKAGNQTASQKGNHKKQPARDSRNRPLEYVAVTVPVATINDTLNKVFSSVSSSKAQFYRNLQKNSRIQEQFHVTLIHRASASQHPVIWARYNEQWIEAGRGENKLGSCNVLLERIVWDARIMAIVVRIVDQDERGWQTVNQVAHITIGTKSNDIKPKESNDLLKRWLAVGSDDESGIGEVPIEARPVLEGTVKGVLSR